MAAQEPVEISRDNDLAFLVGPVKSGAIVYSAASIEGWIASAKDSDTPLGGITNTFPQEGSSGSYKWAFESAQVNAVLAAAGTLVDGVTKLYAIAKGPGDFRVAKALVYRSARAS